MKSGFCLPYHITGECYADSSGAKCDRRHGTRFGEAIVNALAAEARQVPCPNGGFCVREACVYGHPDSPDGESKAVTKASDP